MTLWFGDFDEVWSSTSVLLLSTSQYWMVHSYWLYSHSKGWCTAKQQGCVCFLSRVRHPLDLFSPVFTWKSSSMLRQCTWGLIFTDFQTFRTQWRPCFHVFHILNIGVFWCSTDLTTARRHIKVVLCVWASVKRWPFSLSKRLLNRLRNIVWTRSFTWWSMVLLGETWQQNVSTVFMQTETLCLWLLGWAAFIGVNVRDLKWTWGHKCLWCWCSCTQLGFWKGLMLILYEFACFQMSESPPLSGDHI